MRASTLLPPLLLLLQHQVVTARHMILDFQTRKDDAMSQADDINDRLLHPNGIVTLPITTGWIAQDSDNVDDQMHCKRMKTNDEVPETEKDYGVKYWQLTQCPVDVSYDFRIVWTDIIAKGNDKSEGRSDLFPYWSPKRYNVTMRYRTTMATTEPINDVVMEIRPTSYHGKHVLFRTNVSIPSTTTDGEWHLTSPIELPVEIGGNDDLTFRVTFPTATMNNLPKYCNFQFRDFDFVPPGAWDTHEHSVGWFIEWKDRVVDRVLKRYNIPAQLPYDQMGDFNASATTIQTLIWEEDRAKGADQDGYREPINKEYQTLMDTATPLLESVVDPVLTKVEEMTKDIEWMQAVMLTHGSPLKFADYCNDHGPQACTNLINFLLTDTELMYTFLKYGGAKGGFYGQALDLYKTIQQVMLPGYPVLEKLALAVTLELCEPSLHHRHQSEFELNPIERYKQYEEAYLGGELDPYFEHFTVWELRWSINDDSPDHQIVWAREMLRNYRPDLAMDEDQGIRYGGLQRTDVKYTRPKWTSLPEGDHAQTLSIGGFCGPRAKFSRLINKAFGIPVWGVTVPGHATIMRWKPDGWHTPLGRRWWHGWWDGRDGFDFIMETEIRHELGDDIYLKQVDTIMWIAQMMGEVQQGSIPQVENPWTGLSLMQRRRVRNQFREITPMVVDHSTNLMDTLVEDMLQQPMIEYEPMHWSQEGRYKFVTLPAMSWTANNGGVDWMRSYDGGMQLLFREGGELVYDVNSTTYGLEQGKYKFGMKISTVHSNDPLPFKLAVSSSTPGIEPAVYELYPHYTFGRWDWTDTVEIELGGGMETLELSRDGECSSVSIKQLSLSHA